MKKYLFLMVLFVLVPNGTMAQNWLNRMANDYRQRNQQRTVRRSNIQRSYQYNQRYEEQERVLRQRRETQQRERSQEQQNTENQTSSNTNSSANSRRKDTYQGSDKVVSLVANGTGQTKEEATQNALRNAIEQAYGTFVSANTEVLNDDLVKDEIVTVSTGNIRAYNELSTSQLPSGLYDVSVLAIVSIDQLTKFAQSKGMQAELSGATFAMNMKIRELNKKNEAEAIDHMVEKLKAIAKNGLFDYKLEIGEPFLNKNSNYCIEVDVYFHENDNTKAFYKTIYDTIDALSLTANEIKEYDKANLKYYCYNAQLIPKNGQPLYKLRNKYERIGNDTWEYPWLMPMLIKKALNYVIKDNLGHKWQCRYEKIEDQLIANWNYKKAFEKNNYICWYYEETIHRDTGKGYQKNGHYYTLSPTSRIMGISGEGRSNMLIPIKDYKTTDHDYLHLNPLEALGSYIRKEKRIYFEQRFLIEYTEEELSKLTSITIENKNE